MKKNIKILLSTSFIMILASFDAVYSQGTTSLYINAGAGARAHALGNAYVALADGPTAIFWNPAGLDFMQRKSVTFFYSGLPAESSYGFVGLVLPSITFGSFGFGWLRFGTGGIEERNDPTLISTFDFSEQLFMFSYAKQVKEDLSIGLTFKVENLNLNNSLTRFGTDVGLMYRPDLDNELLRDFSFGFNVQNLLKTQAKLVDSEESSSRNLKLGLMKALYLGENRNALRFLVDWNKPQSAASSLHFGSEFSFKDKATIRLGVNDGQVAFGAGASYNKFRIDYNFGKLFDGAAFSGNHRFSITIDFGKTKREIIEIAQQRREQQFRLRADQEAWFRGEQEFSARIQKGRENFLAKNYLSAVVDFDRAKDAADSLITVAQRLRGEISDDVEANMRVESALSAAEEAQAMLDSANVRQDAQVEAELRRFASEAAQSAREERLRSSVIRQRERGAAFFKQSLFARAIRDWQAALDDINGFGGALPNWAGEIKIQLENNIKMAGTQLEGDVQQGIRRADALERRGQYVQAIQELNRLLQTQPSASERKTIEQRINRNQGQLGFDQNYNQGVRFYTNKDWQNALDAFERALKIKPNHARAKKYYEDARQRALATVKTMPPSVRTKVIRGMQLLRDGRHQEALQILEQANKEQPYNKRILNLIDRALLELKK